MLTKSVIEQLRNSNYFRKASHSTNYWVDFAESKINDYRLKTNDEFHIIIYSELNSAQNYYVVPFIALKKILQTKFLTNDKKLRRRWIGNVVNHKLQISNSAEQIDVESYYQLPLQNTDRADFPGLDNVHVNQGVSNKIPNLSLSQTVLISASDIAAIEEENSTDFEGCKRKRLISYYERIPRLRAQAIRCHGKKCIVCGFDFQRHYGSHGENYIEVHHLKPLATMVEPSLINPETDMTVLCANCHRMVHRKKYSILSISDLIKIWTLNNNTAR